VIGGMIILKLSIHRTLSTTLGVSFDDGFQFVKRGVFTKIFVVCVFYK